MENENLKPIEKLTPFTKMIMTIGTLPSSFYASMSYYESMVWLYEYLKNEVIPTVNNNGEAVEELQEAFTTLENFITNYFDNLDVQEEINHKLDEMAEDGTLADIIADYIQLKGQLVYNSVEEMKEATNLYNGSFAKTYGYYNYKDGGGALYKIRNVTNEDTENDITIIALHDPSLIAELIFEDLNVKQAGAYGDNIHDDTTAFQKCFDLCITNRCNMIIPKGQYLLENPITVTSESNLSIKGNDNFNYGFTPQSHECLIVTKNGFLTASSLTKISGIIENIYFKAYTTNHDDLFTNIELYDSDVRNITAIDYKNILYNSKLSNTTQFHDCKLANIYEAFLNNLQNAVTPLVDCAIHHNYINGKPATNACFIKAGFISTTDIHNNYIDFFKYMYFGTNRISGVNSFNNIYDYGFNMFNKPFTNAHFDNDYFLHFSSNYSSTTQFTFADGEVTDYGVISNIGTSMICLTMTNCRSSSNDHFFYFDTNYPLNFRGSGNTFNKITLCNNIDYDNKVLYDFLIYTEPDDSVNMFIDNNSPVVVTTTPAINYGRSKWYNGQVIIYDNKLLTYYNRKFHNADGTEWSA